MPRETFSRKSARQTESSIHERGKSKLIGGDDLTSDDS
jgi:hypothetical protein